MLSGYVVGIIVFIYGICIGSFLNVCIYRIPESISLIRPPSTCPRCMARVRSYDNIPILSYLMLGGKCRFCRIPISARYPLTELFTGIMWVMTWYYFGISLTFFINIVFISSMIVVTLIDIDHGIIPDVISLPGIPLCFIASILISNAPIQEAALTSAIGILVGGGSLFSIAMIYKLLTGTDGMGMGDVKLLAMIGALIGLKGVFFTIFISSAVGTIIGILLMIVTRNNMKLSIPFGPFLAFGAVLYLFIGDQLIDWYLNTPLLY